MTAPTIARIAALLLAVPLAALSPVAIAAYLVVTSSSALSLCRCPPPCGRYPPPPLRFAAQPPCVHSPPSLSGASPPFLPWASASLAPPYAPLLQAPAADIARRDEDVGDRTGGVMARWLVAGRSAPRGKSPRRPLPVVGDGISLPWFLHRTQQ